MVALLATMKKKQIVVVVDEGDACASSSHS